MSFSAWRVTFPASPLARLGERLSLLGKIIEVVEAIPALHRECDTRDWIADTLAVIVKLLIVGAVRRALGTRSHDSAQSTIMAEEGLKKITGLRNNLAWEGNSWALDRSLNRPVVGKGE